MPLTLQLKLQKLKKKKGKFSIQISTKSSTVEEKQVNNTFKSIYNNIIHVYSDFLESFWFPWQPTYHQANWGQLFHQLTGGSGDH